MASIDEYALCNNNTQKIVSMAIICGKSRCSCNVIMLHSETGGDASGADFRSKNVKVGNFDIIDMIIDFSKNTEGA
jgi:hypothetical protein